MADTHEQRLSAARIAIEGLSVGDAVGRQHSLDSSPPWHYSDDTEMAIAILEVLALHQSINQDALAVAFARRFDSDPERG
jgi:ADP-ribosylglycohydrolase